MYLYCVKKALEITWLTATILSAAAAIHQTVNEGFGKSIIFIILTFVSFLMYYRRKSLRNKENQNNN